MTFQPTPEQQARIDAAIARIPAHLDAEELVDNSYNNAADAGSDPEVVTDVIVATIAMYIDQDCSSF